MLRMILTVVTALSLYGCGGGGASTPTNSGGGVVDTNILPVVSAGNDQQANEQTQVTLSGTANDPDGTIKTYLWQQTGGGVQVTLQNSDSATATFTSPDITANQTLTFKLTVTDNKGGQSSDSVNVLVLRLPNQPPAVDAGADQQVNEQTNVTLNVTATDSDGTISSYAWQQIDTSGVQATLQNADTAAATFTAPAVNSDTTLTFKVTVTDNEGASRFDTVNVQVLDTDNPVANAPPVADAGGDQTTDEQTRVYLHGSGTDSDGSIVSYQWVQLSGQTVVMQGIQQADMQFESPEVDAAETLQFELTVTDNQGATDTNRVSIEVKPVTADHTLADASPSLYRYAVGDNLKYAISLHFRGNSNAVPSNNYGHYNVTYSESQDPAKFSDGLQTMAKTYVLMLPNSSGQEVAQSTIQQEVIQFPDSVGSSSSEIVYIERRAEGIYGINHDNTDGKNAGEIFIPGDASIGFSQDLSYQNLRYDDPNTAANEQEMVQVTQKITIDGTHVIKTALGNFEAYRMNWDYSETSNAGTDTQSGVFWLYPPLGIIKATYVESIGTVSPTAVSDINYTLESTNISY